MRKTITLKDQSGIEGTLRCTINADEGGVWVGFEGYGDSTTKQGGCPVAIELFDEELRLLVWGDINREDPTHIIPLHGARESQRTAD